MLLDSLSIEFVSFYLVVGSDALRPTDMTQMSLLGLSQDSIILAYPIDCVVWAYSFSKKAIKPLNTSRKSHWLPCWRLARTGNVSHVDVNNRATKMRSTIASTDLMGSIQT